LTEGRGFLSKARPFVIAAFAVAVAFAVPGAVAGAVAVAVAVAVAFAGAVAGAVAFAGAGAGDYEAATLILLAWVFMPMANAMADWLSVAATRRFLGEVRDHRPRLSGILGLMLFDFAVGALCLAVLLTLLSRGLDLWAYVHPETFPLDWRDYWATARADPWQGMALWLMALTTLAPTIIHAVMGLSAVISHKSRLNRAALDELKTALARGGPSAADSTTVAKGLVAADIYGFALGLVLVFVPLGWIAFRLGRVFLG
jgi:hypothetical protein